MKRILISYVVMLIAFIGFTQNQSCLENVFVEKIPVSAEAISLDPNLTSNHYIYRVFIDMASGYQLQLISGQTLGDDIDPLEFKTSTSFYNELDNGSSIPTDIRPVPTIDEPVYYDSWLTLGIYSRSTSATQLVPLTEDTDGTVDGFFGSSTGLSLNLSPGFSISVFEDAVSGGNLYESNGSLYIVECITGAGSSNSVCIGQFTTDGEFSFRMNFQIKSTDINNPKTFFFISEHVFDGSYVPMTVIQSDLCIYPVPSKKGCMNSQACNYDASAKEDDGTCVLADQCTTCVASSPYWELVDIDNNGVCDNSEIEGCKNSAACNYNPLATRDNGSCILPEFNCTECLNGQLVLTDYDKDGICNKEDTVGCMNTKSCNYSPTYLHDDGNCTEEPDAKCYYCSNGIAMPYGDIDEDGIADSCDTDGCTDPIACNYNENALLDDGTCVFTDSCHTCINHKLALIDENNNTVCDLMEETKNKEISFYQLSFDFIISPNPIKNSFSLVLTNCMLTGNYTLFIYNILGEIKFKKEFEIFTNSHTILINAEKFFSGSYLVSIADPSGKINSKILIKE